MGVQHYLQQLETILLTGWAVSTSLSLLGWSFLFLTGTDSLLPKKLLIAVLVSSTVMLSMIAIR